MLIQAVAIALAGSWYPLGLLLSIRYLSEARGRTRAFAFVLGGALCLTVAGVIEIIVLNGLGVTQNQDKTPSGIIDMVIGTAMIGLATFLWRSRSKPIRTSHDSGSQRSFAMSVVIAFGIGALVYSPGLGLIASMKVIADADAGTAATTITVLICVAALLVLAEVPIAATFVAPRRSRTVLAQAGVFLDKHGRTVGAVVTAAMGLYMLSRGFIFAFGG